jgi:hypothetical protein
MTAGLAEAGQGSDPSHDYSARPSVLVFCDGAAATDAWERAARLSGCRVADTGSVAGAAERIERQAATHAVLVGVDDGGGEGLEALVARIDEDVRAGRYGAVIATPASLIDRVSAVTLHPAVHHLVDADELQRVTTLALATASRRPRLHDVGKSAATARLQQLSEEVGRVATVLAALAEDEAAAKALVGDDCNEREPDAVDAGEVRAVIRARRLRDHFFKSDLFADPAWDMLLDLFAAGIEGRRVAVSSLCIAAAVPPTTALRWIKALCDQGLFVRVADPEDGRRVFIQLSEPSSAAMEAYMKAARRLSPIAI